MAVDIDAYRNIMKLLKSCKILCKRKSFKKWEEQYGDVHLYMEICDTFIRVKAKVTKFANSPESQKLCARKNIPDNNSGIIWGSSEKSAIRWPGTGRHIIFVAR